MKTITVYDFEMAKLIHVQLHGIEKDAVVEADKAEVDQNQMLILKLGNQKVGEFRNSSVIGWWIQDTGEGQ